MALSEKEELELLELEEAEYQYKKRMASQSDVDEPSTISDLWESFKEGIPGAGLMQKAGSAVNAGIDQLVDLGSDREDKSFGEHYDKWEKMAIDERNERQARSPKASLAGSVAGAFVAPNPASIAGRVGLNIADAATRADSLEEAGKNAGTAAVVSGAMESIPVIGKGIKSLRGLSRGADDVTKPAQEFAQELVEDSGLRKAVGDGIERVGSDVPPPKLQPVLKDSEKNPSIREKVSAYLRNKAEDLAENATGATGHQSSKFSDKAGRELLDRGVVQFGDNSASIARKAGDEIGRANSQIDTALSSLDAKGASVSSDQILSNLDEVVSGLRSDPSQGSVIKQIQSIMEDIRNGPQSYKLSEAEKIKRNFQRQANYDSDAISQDAKKAVARAYMKTVEDVATGIDESLSSLFKTGKESYGLMSPIQEAAEKRTRTLNQSPLGGLLDTAATGVGGAVLGGMATQDPASALATGVGAALTRRQIAPRMSSSAAVAFDKSANFLDNISQSMSKMPQKFQSTLQSAAQRGGNSLAVTHFLLGSQDPEYQQFFKEEENE